MQWLINVHAHKIEEPNLKHSKGYSKWIILLLIIVYSGQHCAPHTICWNYIKFVWKGVDNLAVQTHKT